ncbi:MAG: hypothetical protein ACKPCI_21210 [Dolichospermum sp.]
MPTPRPYIAGDGIPYQRSLTNSSAGTISNPDVAHFALNYSEESPITGATMPSGGVGIIGWLSAIWKQLLGNQRTPGFVNTNTTGTITTGAKSVNIKNVGSAVGTVLTANLPIGETLSFATTGNDTLGAIAYNATGTIFLISEVR